LRRKAILDGIDSLNGQFEKAVDIILGLKGKLIVIGVGKSGIL